jgi:hypothetical protein
LKDEVIFVRNSLEWLQPNFAIDDALQKQSAKWPSSCGMMVEMGSQCCLDDESSKARLCSLRVFDRF